MSLALSGCLDKFALVYNLILNARFMYSKSER